jgi:exopolysaccharide biosynthesis operon protein EpsL
MIRKKLHVGLALLLLPACALAFDTVDTIVYPNTGRFPAYPVDEAPKPWNFFGEVGVLHDNNVARLGSGTNTSAVLGNSSRSDNITRLGAGVRGEQRIYGRQTLRFEARGDQYWYDRYSTYNNFAYGLLGEWRWELGNQLSGALGYSRRRVLVDLAEVQALTKDTITDSHLYANGAYQFAANWRVRGALDHGNLSRGNQAIAGHTDSVIVGGDYVTPLGNALGVEYRRSVGSFGTPETVAPAILVSNEYTEHEVAGVATFVAGPQWRFTGRLGHTNRQHVAVGQRDFSGTTGRANIDWLPGNKTILSFTAYKAPQAIVDATASYVLVSGVQFGPSWAPTAKLVFSARLINEHRQFLGDPGPFLVPGTVQRDETLRGARLGMGWEIQRHTEISFGLDHGIRTSNLVGRDYNYTAVMANLKHNF